MARRKEFDENQVLDAATELFWRQGYKATSIRDLVVHTGLGEGSLYNAFGGKKGLFLAALNRYRGFLERYLNKLDEFESPLDGIRWFVETMAQGLSQQTDFRGCMITNTTIELAPHDPEIQEQLRSIYAQVETAFYKTLRRAQKSGEYPKTRDVRAMARFLSQSLEGLRVLAKADPGPHAIRQMAETTLSLLIDGEPPKARNRSRRKTRVSKREKVSSQ